MLVVVDQRNPLEQKKALFVQRTDRSKSDGQWSADRRTVESRSDLMEYKAMEILDLMFQITERCQEVTKSCSALLLKENEMEKTTLELVYKRVEFAKLEAKIRFKMERINKASEAIKN
ncbi:hypothetical protein LINPERHAP2_LOCUS4017 [Linum perenne]